MEEKPYMLIHLDKNVYRFKCLWEAQNYAKRNCRGSYEFYIIVDTKENKVISKWSY